MATAEDVGVDAGHESDDLAIRQLVAQFAAAWNRHDPASMIEPFAADLSHVSVRGRWQQGRAELEQTYRDNHAGIWKDVSYNPEVELVQFLRPDVAVAIVRGTFQTSVGEDAARATWVLTKENGHWLVRAFHQTYLRDIPIVPQST